MGVLIKIPGATFTDEKYIIGKVVIPEVECDHVYDNACDTTCNLCGATRTTTHNFVDGVCTICGAKDPSNIKSYPVQYGLKGLYALGGTAEASLVNHAPEPHVNDGNELLKGVSSDAIKDNHITFSGAGNACRMETLLRLPLNGGLTYIALFNAAAVSGSGRPIISNWNSTGGLGLNAGGVQCKKNAVSQNEYFNSSVPLNKFVILAMTADADGYSVVRYSDGKLIELPTDGENTAIDAWSTNAMMIGGNGVGSSYGAASISVAAIHTGKLDVDQLAEVCKFVKEYGEHKGLTIE